MGVVADNGRPGLVMGMACLYVGRRQLDFDETVGLGIDAGRIAGSIIERLQSENSPRNPNIPGGNSTLP